MGGGWVDVGDGDLALYFLLIFSLYFFSLFFSPLRSVRNESDPHTRYIFFFYPYS